MQTGTKKTPDRFQNYFCPAAANDIVHHAYAWIVKEPNMQPKFLYCRAIDDPANDRGWNIIAEVWERDVLGGWGISSSTIHPEFEDTADGYVLAEGMPGTAASLPYQVFREVVNEHDTNYLIALAIAIDALPKDSTCDMASETIRANADIDITIDEAIQIRDNACENIWESGGQSDLDEIVWDQIGAEYKSIKSDSHRGLSDVKDAKAKQAVHVNDDRENDAVALDMQEK